MNPPLFLDSTQTSVPPLKEILMFIGKPVVLVPNRSNQKIPIVKGWSDFTSEVMHDERYVEQFTEETNVGVSLGRASSGLISLDFDCEDALYRFLKLNPILKTTFQTKRKRGANLWIFTSEDQIPKSSKIRFEYIEVGEIRSDGNQTLIWGKVKDEGKGENEAIHYKVINPNRPIELDFNQIKWPEVKYTEAEKGLKLMKELIAKFGDPFYAF